MGRNGGGFCGVTWVLGIALALAVSSCDGSDHAGPGVSATSVREACIIWCEKQAESGCPDLAPREQCAETCDAAAAYLPCPQEYIATANCVAQKAAFTCSSSGDLEMRGCWAEMQAVPRVRGVPAVGERRRVRHLRKDHVLLPSEKRIGATRNWALLFDWHVGLCGGRRQLCTSVRRAGPNLGRAAQAMLECNQTCSTTCR